MTLDVFGLPPSFRGDVQVFTGPATVTNLQWQTWRKPRGVSMIHLVCFSGGGGGGAGAAAASGNRGGGGGGGSAGMLRVTAPAYFLPDVLYVQAGVGGAGGAGIAGSDGGLSLVAVAPNTTTANVLCSTGTVSTAAGRGGGVGTVGAIGAGGTAGSLTVIANQPIAGCGFFDAIAGQAGAGGGAVAGAVGSSITLPVTSIRCTGGAGGAGTSAASFAGGGFAATANAYLSEQRPATPASGSNDGSGGPAIWKPMMMFGGCGGSSNVSGAGGAGGNGAYGAGGGGGGAGTSAGRGGNGGAGLVLIVCW